MTNGADSSRLAVEQVEIVMAALGHLTAEQMHTLVMLYYAELTLGQVALIRRHHAASCVGAKSAGAGADAAGTGEGGNS